MIGALPVAVALQASLPRTIFARASRNGLAHLFEERLEKAGFSFRPEKEGNPQEVLYFNGEPVRNKDCETHKRAADSLKELIAGEEADRRSVE
jgi:hypothetical protein